ncbi:hypothetical protein Sste5346_010116 [Sporothrix stenoceras]|uniref:O-methylsterigmatocystin oxidoreductase n=1 Tax=Sporothrix stenoceras TaxID=5173 RepID=A0ABR3YHX3_9PEZI
MAITGLAQQYLPAATPATVVGGLLLLLALATMWGTSVPTSLRAIPGPPGLPVIGNILQMGSRPHRMFQLWANQYGELFRLKLGNDNWVILCSSEAVREIFDKQSAITSGRTPMPVASDVFSGGNRLLFLTYGPKWRKLRAIVHKLLTPKASETYKPSQEFEAKKLIYDLATDNVDEMAFYTHIRRYTTSVVLTSTYGRRAPVWDCDDVREIYQIMNDFTTAAAPGGYVADLLPALARLPTWMQWWRPHAVRGYKKQLVVWMKHWNRLKDQIREGKAPECFVKQFLETDFKKQDITEEQAAFVAGSMLEAGSETTSSALNSCIMYLAACPEVQEMANAELTRVVGDDRSPSYADEDHLPYIWAIGKEVLRIRPVTTIGTPHYTTGDVVYKNYVIPKNTIVCMSQYVLHFDPNKWNDSEKFDPSRYLAYPHKAGYYSAGDARQRDHFDFGGGRRICPGLHLAENSLYITLAKILWAFKIEPPLDENKKPLPMDLSDDAYEEGVNTLPKPFKVRFTPRSQERLDVLKQEWEQAQVDGFYLGNIKVDVNGMVVA